uniref:Coiled-coil domain-containing protein 39 n=1 Tax=Paramoeba aestuarina TaxID=180227 RepID=A0A7S4U635_9EUKA
MLLFRNYDMPGKQNTPSSILECEKGLVSELEITRKRLASLEMTAKAREQERDALLDEIQKLQRQNNDDDTEIAEILLERERALMNSPTKKSGLALCAIASHEATDEIQRKEKLIQLEKFSISALEKRITRLSNDINSVDKQIELTENDLEEVHEKTGYSLAKQRHLVEMMEQEDSTEAFLVKGEEEYLCDMKAISDLKTDIKNRKDELKSLELLLKNKHSLVDKLFAEEEKNECLRKQISHAQNEIRVTDRSIRELSYEKDKRLPQIMATDSELEAVNEHSKFTQSRLALKHDSDYLDELHHKQKAQFQDLQVASKAQESQIRGLEKATLVLEKVAHSLGIVDSKFHQDIKSRMSVPPLETDHERIVAKYKHMEDTLQDHVFPTGPEVKDGLMTDFLEIIDNAHEELTTQGKRYSDLQAELDRKLEELKETLKYKMQIKASEANDQLEETINTARHTEALKAQLGAQQEHINEEMKSPLKRRVMMQRKLSEKVTSGSDSKLSK